jgi:hypothetical protein
MKLHDMRMGYIYASVRIEINCYSMMIRKERRSTQIELCTVWVYKQYRQKFNYMSNNKTWVLFGFVLFFIAALQNLSPKVCC